MSRWQLACLLVLLCLCQPAACIRNPRSGGMESSGTTNDVDVASTTTLPAPQDSAGGQMLELPATDPASTAPDQPAHASPELLVAAQTPVAPVSQQQPNDAPVTTRPSTAQDLSKKDAGIRRLGQIAGLAKWAKTANPAEVAMLAQLTTNNPVGAAQQAPTLQAVLTANGTNGTRRLASKASARALHAV